MSKMSTGVRFEVPVNVIDPRTAQPLGREADLKITLEGISDIVSHARQAMLARRVLSGDELETVYDELAEALCVYAGLPTETVQRILPSLTVTLIGENYAVRRFRVWQTAEGELLETPWENITEGHYEITERAEITVRSPGALSTTIKMHGDLWRNFDGELPSAARDAIYMRILDGKIIGFEAFSAAVEEALNEC